MNSLSNSGVNVCGDMPEEKCLFQKQAIAIKWHPEYMAFSFPRYNFGNRHARSLSSTWKCIKISLKDMLVELSFSRGAGEVSTLQKENLEFFLRGENDILRTLGCIIWSGISWYVTEVPNHKEEKKYSFYSPVISYAFYFMCCETIFIFWVDRILSSLSVA
jgi:hypothetical protein